MSLTKAEAERLLSEAGAMNPGPWIEHSQNVALAARVIAEVHPRFDPERVYVLGLLHDIGRRFGARGDLHVLLGYEYLLELGEPQAARIALTHSPALFDPVLRDKKAWDGTDEEWERLLSAVAGVELDEQDRLFQLCDCLALADGLCTLPERLIDVAMRYGVSPEEPRRWQVFFDNKAEVDRACGQNIYRLLPGLCERLLA